MTPKVRPAMSTRHSRPRRSRSRNQRRQHSGHGGCPGTSRPGPPTIRKSASTDSFLQDQLCLKALRPTHTVSCFRFRYNRSPFYIYTYTEHAHIKQTVSSLHLFSIYPSRDHFIIHVKKRTLFQTNSRPCASGWVSGQPRGCCSVALHAPCQTTGTLAVFMWPRLLSHITPLRTLWNLNCTCISFPSNNDQHYFSEQTVKGALERGVDWGKQRSPGTAMPASLELWCPLVSPYELSVARAGLCRGQRCR